MPPKELLFAQTVSKVYLTIIRRRQSEYCLFPDIHLQFTFVAIIYGNVISSLVYCVL